MYSSFLVSLVIFQMTLVVVRSSINVDELIFRVKWLTPDSKLPIRIEKPLKPQNLKTDLKWYLYPEELYIDEIDDYETFYAYRQTNNSIELDILKYDHQIHDQLTSFIARPVGSRASVDKSDIDIFTLAYLKRQEISFEYGSRMSTISCNVSILVHSGDSNFNKLNTNLVLNNLHIRLGFFNQEDVEFNNKTCKNNNFMLSIFI